MPTRLISIPFALGQNEDEAPRELPAGPLREAVNVRQRHGSAFGVRPDYPAVAADTYDTSNLVAYDLYDLNGRLLALGDQNSQSRPTDIFEYVQQPGGTWRGTFPVGHSATATRIPAATRLRNMGLSPDQAEDITVVRAASVGGVVGMAFGVGLSTGGGTTRVHIFAAASDSTLLFGNIPLRNVQVVVAGTSLWFVGVDSSSDLIGYRFDTSADAVLQSPTTLYTGTVTNVLFDAVSVTAVTQAEFVVFIRDASTTIIRRFNAAGAQQLTFAGPAVGASILCVEADSAINQIVTMYRVGAADAVIQTFNLTTGASVAGPFTTVFNQVVTGDMTLVRSTQVGSIFVEAYSEATGRQLHRALFVGSTLTAPARTKAHNFNLAGRGAFANGGVITPVQADSSNMLLMHERSMVLAITDHRVAVDGTVYSSAGMGGSLAKDYTNGKYYWARLVEGTEGQQIPQVSEFEIDSLDRRQGAQQGNELFLTGACPMIYDGRQLVESGFIEAPVFAVAPVTNGGGGQLLGGAVIDYVAVYQWTDSQDRIARSAVSAIQTVTIASADSSMTCQVFDPHTLRRDTTTGSSPSICLYRTFSSVELITATITSGRNFSTTPAAAGDFTGLTLILSVDGGAGQTVTFSATDNTLTELVSAVNVQTTGCTAFVADDSISIESDTDGIGGSISVTGGTSTAAGIGFSGFFVGQTDTGITTFTKGTVFQLCLTAIVDPSAEFGAPHVLVDSNISDTALLTQPALYTQGERGALTGILQHDPVPSCEFCAVVGDHIIIGGLTDRSEVRVSKALFQAETIGFSDDDAFGAVVAGNVTAVAGLDGVPIVFTADDIYKLSPQFADDNGDNGELGPPFRLPSEGGCSNANSIVETSMGLFYQSRDNKLMLIPRGGSSPVWIGRLVRDTLALFPVITGAAYVDVDHCVVFTCHQTSQAINSTGVILVFDLRIGQWYIDTFSSTTYISAAAQHQGLLAFARRDGSVCLQATSLTPAAFIPYNAKSGSLELFLPKKWGKFVSVEVFGEKRGDANIVAQISYDDGQTFTDLATKAITTAAGYTTGESFTAQWFPGRRKGSTFVLNFKVLTAGTATEALILNEYVIEVDAAAPVGRTRTSTAERG